MKNCLTRLTIEESSWEKNERERLEDMAEVEEQETITRFREKVENHLAANDMILNIVDDATRAEKPTRPTSRLEGACKQIAKNGNEGWKSTHSWGVRPPSWWWGAPSTNKYPGTWQLLPP